MYDLYNPFYINPNPPATEISAKQGLSYQGAVNQNPNYMHGGRYTGMQRPGMNIMQNRRMIPPPQATPPEGSQAQTPNNTFGKVAGYAGAALNGYAGGAAGTDGFNLDTNAGFKGSIQGLQSGGPIGAVIGGIAGQIGTNVQSKKALNALDTNVSGYSMDAFGNPVYNTQGILGAQKTANDLTKADRKARKSWDFATRISYEALGTRKKMQQKRDELRFRIAAAQNQFNAANLSSENQEQARMAYQMSQERLFNNPVELPNQYNIYG